MSLSIPHAILIRGATRLAGNVANRVGQAIGFDDVLDGTDANGPEGQADGAKNVAGLHQQLTAAIQVRLSDAGIATNPSVQLSVTHQGGLRVEGNHPRAAEIESRLNADSTLVETAKQLRSASGKSEIRIDLTSRTERANMIGPGGYPNW